MNSVGMTRIKDVHDPAFGHRVDSSAIHDLRKKGYRRTVSELSLDTITSEYLAEGACPVDS